MADLLFVLFALFFWGLFYFSFSKDRSRYRNAYLLFMALAATYVTILYFSGKMPALSDMFIRLALNTVLLQSLYPSAEVAASMNGVSWFLSTIMILYILYPFFFRLKQRR